MSATEKKERTLLFMSNKWVNTIYTAYGTVKQRIFLEVLQSLQEKILQVMRGARVTDFKVMDIHAIDIDMSRLVHYNNYHQVRKAVKEMCEQPIRIYNDISYKTFQYADPTPLLHAFKATSDKKILRIGIKKNIAELLLHVDFSRSGKNAGKAFQYTKFDTLALDRVHCSSKYTFPIYTKICSYGEKSGFEMPIDELREWLQVEEKYKGFDNFHRYVLKHVQKELQISGKYGFNFSVKKTGKVVKSVVFKIFNNEKYDPNHIWLKLRRALTEELPYFARFTDEQREQFNYLLQGHDLEKVYAKFQHIHKALVKRKEAGDAVNKPFIYTIRVIHDAFPPPG